MKTICQIESGKKLEMERRIDGRLHAQDHIEWQKAKETREDIPEIK